MKRLKTNSGITLITLIITVLILLIISATGIYASVERLKINNVKKMFIDIEVLEDKTSEYYLTNAKLPIIKNGASEYEYPYTIPEIGAENLRIIDLSSLEGLTLSYGEGFKELDLSNLNNDLYVINKETFQIFYAQGLEANDKTYYTKETKNIGEIIGSLGDDTEGGIVSIEEGYQAETNVYYCRARVRCTNINNKIESEQEKFNLYYKSKEAEGWEEKGQIPSGSIITVNTIGYYEIRLGTEAIANFELRHKWRDWSAKIPATCTESGIDIRTCEICGVEEERTSELVGHTWGEWTRIKEPTCVETGEEKRICIICGKEDYNTIPATGIHTPGNWQTIQESTCTQEGIKKKYCTVCNIELEIETTPITGHIVGDWITVQEANCQQEGIKKRYCTRCNTEFDSQTTPKTDHIWGEWQRTIGNGTMEVKRICTVCGYQDSTTLKIGDYVDYNYDTSTSYYTLGSGYLTNTTPGNQRINRLSNESINWRIMDIDGTTGQIDLITEYSPISVSSSKGTHALYLTGQKGYNNCVYLLNYISKQLFSNNTLGITARSLKIEDIEKQMNTTGKNARANYKSSLAQYGGSYYFSVSGLFAKKHGIPNRYDSVISKAGSNFSLYEQYRSDETFWALDSTTSGVNKNVTIYQTYYPIGTIGNSAANFTHGEAYRSVVFNGSKNFIASNWEDCTSSSDIYFGVFFTTLTSSTATASQLFRSKTTAQNLEVVAGIRPVVSLDYNNFIVYSGNGEKENPRNIEKLN